MMVNDDGKNWINKFNNSSKTHTMVMVEKSPHIAIQEAEH